MCRRLALHVVTSYLAVQGETNPSAKWMYRKLARYHETTGDETLMNRYLDLVSRPFDESTAKGYVRETMKYCQELNGKIQSALQVKQLQHNQNA